MRQLTRGFVCLVIVFSVLGCGDDGGGGSSDTAQSGAATPEEGFALLKERILADDGDGLWDILAEPSRTALGEQVEMFKAQVESGSGARMLEVLNLTAEDVKQMKTGKDLVRHMGKMMSGKNRDELRRSKLLNVEREGDVATLTIDTGEEDHKTRSMRAFLVDGRWYMNLKDMD